VNAGDIVIDAFSADTGGRLGIYQSGAINAANGSDVTFTTNNKIDHNGTFVMAANTSGAASNITFDTTSGTKASSISGGPVTIAANTSSSAINYILKSAGSNINPGLIGTTSIALPGAVLVDNTFGCSGSGCTPATAYVSATANNLVALATSSAGATIDDAIFASGNITINASSNAYRGIDASVNITSRNGNVILNGSTVQTIGVYVVAGNVVTGNNITINGTSTAAPGWVTQIGGLTINSSSVGGNIMVTGHVVGIPGTAGGVYQTGTITGASGSNISFISNNNINQGGTINLAANTSGTAANISYDVTAGNKTSTVITGPLNIAAGSSAGVNYSVLASGAAINIASAVTVPGAVTLDNTYGCSGTGCTPATGYLNTSLTGWNNLVTTGGYGILVGGNISGTAITINGVNAGGSTGGGGAVMLTAGLTATSGNINIVGTTTTGLGVGNLYGGAWGVSPIIANSGAVNITGRSTTTGNGVELGPNNSIRAKSITVIGSEVGGTYAVYLNTLTIVAGGTNLNITGTVGDTSHTGLCKNIEYSSRNTDLHAQECYLVCIQIDFKHSRYTWQ
jgi:hypothetical protein